MYLYWNTNSTTRVRRKVLTVVNKYLNSSRKGSGLVFHNPSDITISSRKLFYEVITNSREKVSKLIHANSCDSIIFTSGGSESNSMALNYGRDYVGVGGTIVVSAVEHDSIILYCQYLKNKGYNVIFIGVDERGRLKMDELKDMSLPEKVFVSIMLVNNELGNIYDIETVVKIIRQKSKNAIVHTDAVQAVGKIDVDVQKLGVDMLSLSGHKIGAPKGIGALFVKKSIAPTPMIFGHQECGFRGGTENVAYIAGLGVAAQMTLKELKSNIRLKIKYYRDTIENNILKICNEIGVNAYVNGDEENRVGNTTSITIEGIDSTKFILAAENQHLYLSSGAACSSSLCDKNDIPKTKASNVMTAICHRNYESVLRISIGDEVYVYSNTPKHPKRLDAAIKLSITDGCARFRKILKTQIEEK